MATSGLSIGALVWFFAILVLIPLVLWFVKRSPAMAATRLGQKAGTPRHIGSLPLSPNQRVVTVEVGEGDERRWLVLGVTASSITTLHTMAPQTAPDPAASGAPGTVHALPPFAQMLSKLRPDRTR